jgi:alpha-L-fucosidase
MNKITIFLLLGLFSRTIFAQTELNPDKMSWWQDAKFGMFIHWGIFSVPSGKWENNTNYGETIMFQAKIPVAVYAKLATQFNPEKFDAEEWVKIARAAGQKYIIITSKHHDGFAMFKSNASDFNIVDATPFKRDPLKELADACRKYDMKLGFYYSQSQDWHHPGGARYDSIFWDDVQRGDMDKYVDNIAIPQVREILSNYGDIAIMWWDTPLYMNKKMSQKLADLLKPYPNIIFNDRLGVDMGGDFETPEQYIPATGLPGRNWEVCMTMNGFWGYNAFDERWKSTKELLHKLIDIVSKGGNFLLNVGPDANGVIPEVCQQNLIEIGDWLKVNGEAIYGTKASPFHYLSYGRATLKEQILYLHVFDWPKDGKLKIPFANKVIKAYLLADTNTILSVEPEKDHSKIQLPEFSPDKIASVVAIHFEGDPIVQPIPSLRKKVLASSSDNLFPANLLTDGDADTYWMAEGRNQEATLEIDLEKFLTIQSISLIEPYHKWLIEHELQYLKDKEWVTIFKKETNNRRGISESFEPVTAQKFRIIIRNRISEPPMISEILLFGSE